MQKKKIKPLRRQFVIPLVDDNGDLVDEVLLDTNFRLVEIIERVYRMNSDYVVIQHLSDPRNILRSQISEVIALWVQGKTDYKHSQVKELIFGADQKEYEIYIGAIQGVALFCSRQIDCDAFDSLASGNGLPEPEEDEAEDDTEEEEVEKPVKKPTTSPRRKTKKLG